MRRFLSDVRQLLPACAAYLGVVTACAGVVYGWHHYAQPSPDPYLAEIRQQAERERELRADAWRWKCAAADLAAENAKLRAKHDTGDGDLIPPQDVPAVPPVRIPSPAELGINP